MDLNAFKELLDLTIILINFIHIYFFFLLVEVLDELWT